MVVLRRGSTNGPFVGDDMAVTLLGMRDPLRSKHLRLAVYFWLLFTFWIVGLVYGLRGGLITYSLLLLAVVVLAKASRTRKT